MIYMLFVPVEVSIFGHGSVWNKGGIFCVINCERKKNIIALTITLSTQNIIEFTITLYTNIIGFHSIYCTTQPTQQFQCNFSTILVRFQKNYLTFSEFSIVVRCVVLLSLHKSMRLAKGDRNSFHSSSRYNSHTQKS